MKFRFDPNLDFQTRAIESVVQLFDGATRLETGFELIAEDGVISNDLTLTEGDLLENLRAVQGDEELQGGAAIPAAKSLNSLDFSIEMETSTGKTYVYLRTAFELHKKHGFRKFIIVVPSVAIRKGVIKTFEMTKDHFGQIYDHLPYRFYEYDSTNLSKVRQFTSSNDVEFMIMTLASFDKAINVFNRSQDRMMGRSPLELVQNARPILILDEPQNMEGAKGKKALESLNPLFKLRYSATHRKLYHLVYRFTPVDAYRQGFVKKIEVASVVQDHDANRAYVECKSVKAKKTVVSAKLKVYVQGKSGPEPKYRTVQAGDDLQDVTGLPAYEGWVVESVDAGYGEVSFRNGRVISEGTEIGPDHEAIARVQIATTIEKHMRKAHRLRRRGIKVLSLFFIDEVASYVGDDGYIRRCFIEEYDKLRQSDRAWAKHYADVAAEDVQGSYFSEYKAEWAMEGDEDAYELIMKNKEQLLSFDEPTEFIFSHSALREGWNNPNVFQICTLNRTISTMRKRQEIGRGMRLAVDQSGERIFDDQVNLLTVVANQSYAEYVAQLQREYIDDVGHDQEPPTPKDARKRKTVRLKKGFELDADFKELWADIARRTRYRVNFDEKRLNAEAAAFVGEIEIQPIKIRTTRVAIDTIEDGGHLVERRLGDTAQSVSRKRPPVPNLAKEIAEKTMLTWRTVRRVLTEAGNLDHATRNPAEYIDRASAAINRAKRRLLVEGVRYVELEGIYEMSLFQDIESYEDNLVPIEKSIYDHVVYESGIERDFAEALEAMDEVQLFIKLPAWFTVTTPVGEYNPDWAVLFQVQDAFGEVQDRLALIRETKGTIEFDQLRESEQMKIKCAERHFDALGVSYSVVDGAKTFRDQLS